MQQCSCDSASTHHPCLGLHGTTCRREVSELCAREGKQRREKVFSKCNLRVARISDSKLHTLPPVQSYLCSKVWGSITSMMIVDGHLHLHRRQFCTTPGNLLECRLGVGT